MDDLISRQAAIDALVKAIREDPYYDSDGAGLGVCDVRVILSDLPSAQLDLSGYSDRLWRAAYERGKAEAERKTGKWINAVLPNDSSGLRVQVCDQCDTFFPLAYTGGGHNYCPNCGANMRGEWDE